MINHAQLIVIFVSTIAMALALEKQDIFTFNFFELENLECLMFCMGFIGVSASFLSVLI